MLICLTLEQENLDSLLSTHFEKTKYFLLFNDETSEAEVIKNKKSIFQRVKPSHLVAEKKPDAVITGNIEPDSFDFFRASGIKIISGIFGISGHEALKRYKEGRLKEVTAVKGAARGRII
ncbi:MAG: NifB/NifX family molybdenum-iron cluster-binding protein [Patescibacteria group bacterium]